jgi:hypothetical protein
MAKARSEVLVGRAMGGGEERGASGAGGGATARER